MLVSPENTRSLPNMFLEITLTVVQVPEDDVQYTNKWLYIYT